MGAQDAACEKRPNRGHRAPARRRDAGIRPWTEEDVAAYEKRWPIGTRQRVWLDVLLYTGLRRGDAVRPGRQHVRDGIATIKTEKTGTIVTIPILPVLAETLAAGPCGDLSFIAGSRGQPMAKQSFSNEFAIACRAAGVPGSAHGVRKIAATRAANAGATVAELEATSDGRAGRWRHIILGSPTGALGEAGDAQAGRTKVEVYRRTLGMRIVSPG